MEKQTKEKAIKEAVKKYPYKKECKIINLIFNKEEKEFILEQIEIQLDSYRSGGGKVKKKKFDFSGTFSEDMFDIKILKSIYNKLNSEVRNSSHA